MIRFNKPLIAAFMSAAMLVPNIVQAMEIIQFDKMADQDKSDFVGGLVVGAENVLRDEGRFDLAEKVRTLMTTIDPASQSPFGIGEFEKNLARWRVADLKNAAKDSSARGIEIEDVMALTLRENGIEVPDSFFAVQSRFRPKYPPQQ